MEGKIKEKVGRDRPRIPFMNLIIMTTQNELEIAGVHKEWRSTEDNLLFSISTLRIFVFLSLYNHI